MPRYSAQAEHYRHNSLSKAAATLETVKGVFMSRFEEVRLLFSKVSL